MLYYGKICVLCILFCGVPVELSLSARMGHSSIINGSPANTNEYPEVVQVLVYDTATFPPTAMGYCGGAKLSSRQVLTSAHCLDAFSASPETRQVFVRELFDGPFSSSTTTATARLVSAFASHPSYANPPSVAAVPPRYVSAGYDVAVLYLEAPSAGSSPGDDFAVLARDAELFGADASWLGSAVTVLGWGATAANATNSSADSFVEASSLRIGTMKLASQVPLRDGARCCLEDSQGVSLCTPLLSILCVADVAFRDAASGGVDACVGDSGGPVFLGMPRGEISGASGVANSLVIGLPALLLAGCASASAVQPLQNYTVITDITVHRDWIDSRALEPWDCNWASQTAQSAVTLVVSSDSAECVLPVCRSPLIDSFCCNVTTTDGLVLAYGCAAPSGVYNMTIPVALVAGFAYADLSLLGAAVGVYGVFAAIDNSTLWYNQRNWPTTVSTALEASGTRATALIMCADTVWMNPSRALECSCDAVLLAITFLFPSVASMEEKFNCNTVDISTRLLSMPSLAELPQSVSALPYLECIVPAKVTFSAPQVFSEQCHNVILGSCAVGGCTEALASPQFFLRGNVSVRIECVESECGASAVRSIISFTVHDGAWDDDLCEPMLVHSLCSLTNMGHVVDPSVCICQGRKVNCPRCVNEGSNTALFFLFSIFALIPIFLFISWLLRRSVIEYRLQAIEDDICEELESLRAGHSPRLSIVSSFSRSSSRSSIREGRSLRSSIVVTVGSAAPSECSFRSTSPRSTSRSVSPISAAPRRLASRAFSPWEINAGPSIRAAEPKDNPMASLIDISSEEMEFGSKLSLESISSTTTSALAKSHPLMESTEDA